ncbi:hypothetical protein [Alistipes indistinctus]|uniref:hypothetical protein n=1 Tax=Alistipes indistinctus TaxID=626932 RepID=UPI0015FD5EFA|nr:hypothetical protein [Alistipes indistinctus]
MNETRGLPGPRVLFSPMTMTACIGITMPQGKARQGKARQGKTRQDKTRQDKTTLPTGYNRPHPSLISTESAGEKRTRKKRNQSVKTKGK